MNTKLILRFPNITAKQLKERFSAVVARFNLSAEYEDESIIFYGHKNILSHIQQAYNSQKMAWDIMGGTA